MQKTPVILRHFMKMSHGLVYPKKGLENGMHSIESITWRYIYCLLICKDVCFIVVVQEVIFFVSVFYQSKTELLAFVYCTSNYGINKVFQNPLSPWQPRHFFCSRFLPWCCVSQMSSAAGIWLIRFLSAVWRFHSDAFISLVPVSVWTQTHNPPVAA